MKAASMRLTTSLRKGTDHPTNSDEVTDLIRWSLQEIRRIVVRLAQCRIEPRHIIA